MDNKFIVNWQEYTQNAIAATKELETITTAIVEKLTGKQMELANVAFEMSTKYMSAFSEVKGVQDLLAEQTKLATEFNEKVIETARSTADIITESREAYQSWIEKSMKTATANADFTLPNFLPAKKPAKKAA